MHSVWQMLHRRRRGDTRQAPAHAAAQQHSSTSSSSQVAISFANFSCFAAVCVTASCNCRKLAAAVRDATYNSSTE
jgi:hypothetical protein